jgi:epoxyqueuosine reductase
MAYLTSQVARRSDLRSAFPWARSVVCGGLQYDTPHPYSTAAPPDRGWISRYAWGDDYHDVMKALLDRVVERLRAEAGPFEARTYVDTGPVAEKALAAAAGLGSWGKNGCLLHPEHGSWFFLGEIVTDLDLPADAPRADLCGSCTACLEACPTGALVAPYVLDATRCISYLTIEVKGAILEERRAGLGRHVVGCDLCQDVCPGTAGAGTAAARRSSRGRVRPRTSPTSRASTRGLPAALPRQPGEAGEAAGAGAQRRARPRQRRGRRPPPCPRAAGRRRGPRGARARRVGAAAARRAAQFRRRLFLSSIL